MLGFKLYCVTLRLVKGVCLKTWTVPSSTEFKPNVVFNLWPNKHLAIGFILRPIRTKFQPNISGIPARRMVGVHREVWTPDNSEWNSAGGHSMLNYGEMSYFYVLCFQVIEKRVKLEFGDLEKLKEMGF